LLSVSPPEAQPAGFHDWQPEARASLGDVVTIIALDGEDVALPAATQSSATDQSAGTNKRAEIDLGARIRSFWSNGTQTQRAAVLCAFVIPFVFALGTILYKQHYKEITWHDALNVSMVLILGGYDNLFGSLKLPFPIPAWLHVFSVAQTVAGTLFIGIVYAFLTERVLSARFQFRRRRPPIPRADHTVIVGMGRVGRAVAARLADFGQPMIGTDTADIDTDVLPAMPFIAGDAEQTLKRVNLETCRAMMALTNDEVANLELALLARAANPACELVIRTDDPYFSKNVSDLVPRAYALGVNALAGEAFAAAAFGESIVSLFRVGGRTALVTEYQVHAGDPLDGRLLSNVAYGYDVVPLVLKRPEGAAQQMTAKIFPSEDIRLMAGDALVVLATIDGLQRVELGDMLAATWTVEVQTAPSPEASFEGAMTIARLSGCEPEVARELMSKAPAVLDVALYEHQALDLVRSLRKNLVEARAVPLGTQAHVPVLNLP
jgi:Trk K+ transport system NAD-binding subunit